MSRRRRTTRWLLALCGVALCLWLVIRWPWLMREPVGPTKAELPPEIACHCSDILADENSDIVTRMEKLQALEHQFRALVGHTEADIAARYGPPAARWDGHCGLPSIEFRAKYPDEVTAVYHRGTCTLYVSYCRQRGRLVCHGANLVPVNTVF